MKRRRLLEAVRMIVEELLADQPKPKPRPPAAPVGSPDTIYTNLHTGEMSVIGADGQRQPLHFRVGRPPVQTEDGFWVDPVLTDAWTHRLSSQQRRYSSERMSHPYHRG